MKKDKTKIIILAAAFFVMTAACWFKAPTAFSASERRPLAQFPEISAETIFSGEAMSDFEGYSQDQFPLRESFRGLKAVSEYFGFLKKDNNDIYIKDGYAAKLNFPLNDHSVENAIEKFQTIYDNYLSDSKVYVSVIPDKSYFLATGGSYPAMDYDRLFAMVKEGMDFAEYIDITGTLQIEDYYKTDTHWRQECIGETAKELASSMGVDLKEIDNLKAVTALEDFRGVYYGQSALPLKAEPLIYLTGSAIQEAQVFNFETNKTGAVYDLEKITGEEKAKDPYDVFLSGAAALMTIENPLADTDKELVIFRDSFGSSLAPLLTEAYSKITLIDIRYVQQGYIGQLVDFTGQDVLFIYGTSMLNDSFTFK